MSKYKGRHRKATKVDKTVAKVAMVGMGATAIPLTFMSGSAQAAPIENWEKIAVCESNGRWDIDYGDGGRSVHGGGLQFQPASWRSALNELERRGYDTSDFGQWASTSTKNQQILAAEALLAAQDSGIVWACNRPGAWTSVGVGALSMAPGHRNSSMFEGGVNPFGDSQAPSKPKKKDMPDSGTYTVKSGDTLSGIAYTFSLDGGWKKLYNLNKDVVGSNPDVIEIGMVLSLKEKAGTKAPDKDKNDEKKNKTSEKKSNKSTYTVVKGDTLYDISIAHGVGDGGLETWKPLYNANKKVVGDDPDYILPGQVLHLPGGKPDKPEKAEKKDKKKDKKKKESVNSVEYTVRKGDTLSYLAQWYYGDASEYPRIFNANRPPMHSDPNALKVGWKLTIPGTSKEAPPKRKVATSGYVLPLPAGTYNIGDSIINSGGCVSRSCGGHSGLDLSVGFGTHVKAVAAGVVVHAGYGGAGAAYGDHVIIKHNDGKYTLYGHMSSHNVSEGQSVNAGNWIGNVGSTGTSSGPHLHLEVRNSATAFSPGVFSDPVSYLRSHGVNL